MELKTQFLHDYQRHALSLTDLCERYHISRKTAYQWIHRFEQEGTAGLAERSRRPHHSPRQTPDAQREAILAARRRHPTWGADKLLALLRQREPQAAWPSRWTVCDLLQRAGLVRPSSGASLLIPVNQPCNRRPLINSGA